MNPGKPEKKSDVASLLGHWAALVETLEKYGPACSSNLPFRIDASRAVMTRARD